MKPEDVGGDLIAAFQDAHSWGGLRAGIAAVASLVVAPTPTWRTMDSAPRDGTRVLVAQEGDIAVASYMTALEDETGGWIIWRRVGPDALAIRMPAPTYWQALPEPPVDDHG